MKSGNFQAFMNQWLAEMATSPLPPTSLPGGIEAGGGGEEGGGGGGALIHSPPVESTGKENNGGGSVKHDGQDEGVGERSGLKRGEEEVSNSSGLHKCQYCAKHYSSSHSLRTHEKWHRGDLGHPCSHCDKKFRNPSEVRRHEMTHTGEKPHKCPHCPTKFIQKVLYVIIIQIIHLLIRNIPEKFLGLFFKRFSLFSHIQDKGQSKQSPVHQQLQLISHPRNWCCWIGL